MKKLRNKISLILCMMLVVSMVFTMTACNSKQATTETEQEVVESTTQETTTDDGILGEGETEFFFTATDAEGNSTDFTIHTDKKTVGEALLDLGLIAGDESEYGLYVKTVNGITADYDKDQTYWAFYVDGEYASTGVDSTDIKAGSTYMFKVEK